MQKAQWVWFIGDYEIMQLNKCLTSRYERDVFIPPFWKTDDFYKNVKFVVEFELTGPDEIKIAANGKFNIIIDNPDNPKNELLRNFDGYLRLDKGKYKLTISVYNDITLPAVFVSGKQLVSGPGFYATCNDFKLVPVGYDGIFDINTPPDRFVFSYRKKSYEILEKNKENIIVDCQSEMMGILDFSKSKGFSKIKIFYGESLPEAKDLENCELIDVLEFPLQTQTEVSKAFRYINIYAEDLEILDFDVLFEFVPQQRESKFVSSDNKLNKIYEISKYTLFLNTREFFLDGIKRDRWVWGGDATQCYLMNFYSFFDLKTTKRTMSALGGKIPMATYINHIMDYSFYWIISLYDFYMYVGDVEFLRRMFSLAEDIIRLTQSRKNKKGFVEGILGDWIFVDWANLDNRGAVAVEQILYLKVLNIMEELCHILDINSQCYTQEKKQMQKLIFSSLWDSEKNVFYYSEVGDELNKNIKRHPHIFALLFDILDEKQKEKVKNNIFLNDSIEKIVTPYMRFYELSALCEIGEFDYVLEQILSYWGGMLDEGATSFWELFDKNQKGNEKYAMYNRPYGKSLCHAWGASPLYLIGRYFVGLLPTSPGYKTFMIKPRLCNLEYYNAVLPMLNGDLFIDINRNKISVYSPLTDGKLYLDQAVYVPDKQAKQENGHYVYDILKGERLVVDFTIIKESS